MPRHPCLSVIYRLNHGNQTAICVTYGSYFHGDLTIFHGGLAVQGLTDFCEVLIVQHHVFVVDPLPAAVLEDRA